MNTAIAMAYSTLINMNNTGSSIATIDFPSNASTTSIAMPPPTTTMTTPTPPAITPIATLNTTLPYPRQSIQPTSMPTGSAIATTPSSNNNPPHTPLSPGEITAIVCAVVGLVTPFIIFPVKAALRRHRHNMSGL
ncbi:hypothetical protein NX059_001320 [Plenodomus lindquistii]|nr:hypothetical protein NX059_001320 [Plenodomus lindquistii]